jgi:hypothetical protein
VAQPQYYLLLVGQVFHHCHHSVYMYSLFFIGRQRYADVFNACGVGATAQDADTQIADNA